MVVQGEIVSHMQSMLGMKLEEGCYKLKASYLPGNNTVNTGLRIKNHMMDTVIDKIEEEL